MNKKRLQYILVFAISFLVYANTINHSFVLDDDVVFLQNQFVQKGIKGIPDIVSHGFLYGFNQRNDQSYRPVVLIFYAIEKSIFGNDPTTFHLLNMLYYALLCFLLFKLLKALFQEEDGWLAFGATILFAVHPVHTEVVANIKGRDDILHATFLILSFITALKYVDLKEKKYLFYSLLTFFLALLCKEMAVTYMALLPLTLWTFRSVQLKQIFDTLAYYFAPFALYFILRNIILDTLAFDEEMTVINNGLAAAESYPEQLATTFLIFGKYISLLFFPHPLSWDYSFPQFPIVSFSDPIVLLIVAILLGLTIFSLLRIKSKDKIAYSFLFFVISFSVVSNFFILIGATLGERFLFFPSIAFCIFMVVLIDKLIKKAIQHKAKGLKVYWILLAIICIPLSLKTWDRNKDWENNETLFTSGIEATPNSSRAVSAYASVLRERGEAATNPAHRQQNLEQALEWYQKSINLYDGNADAYYNLGVTFMTLNQEGNALNSFKHAVSLQAKHIKALNNIGVLYFRNNRLTEAEGYFQECLRININFQSAYANLGAIYHNQGNKDKARRYYQRALELDPNDINTRNNMSKL